MFDTHGSVGPLYLRPLFMCGCHSLDASIIVCSFLFNYHADGSGRCIFSVACYDGFFHDPVKAFGVN